MKRIDVVGALIRQEGHILLAQRSCERFDCKWEFAGGKVETGETHQEALHREIKEELNIDIDVGEKVASTDFQINDQDYRLHCYWAEISTGKPVPEHRRKQVRAD